MEKKKRVVKKKAPVTKALQLHIPPVPVLKEALVCAVDEPRRWGQRPISAQYSAKEMVKFAEIAANLGSGRQCFFCGSDSPPTAEEDVLRFHPERELCECLTPLRRMAFDYVNWDSEEAKQGLVAKVREGLLDPQTPIYQYICRCGQVEIVTAKVIVTGMELRKKHKRRKLCARCYREQIAVNKRSEEMLRINAPRPLHGPQARITLPQKEKATVDTGPLPRASRPLNSPMLAYKQ